MKAGIALAAAKRKSPRKLVAGIHDTDYFAKLPSGQREPNQFKAVSHNDTSTKGLWSAAAEFSALFGSETVVTKEALLNAGLRLEKISKGRPAILDEATEAWGWRGIVSLDENPPISAEVSMRSLYPELYATLEWAIDTTLKSVCQPQRPLARARGEELLRLVKDAYEACPEQSLSSLYEGLLSKIYDFVAGEPVALRATRTTELLKFNPKTSTLPRFDLVNLFVSPDSAEEARNAYNEALKGAEIYGLERFGTGAIPFDLVVPGKGRGTVRIGNRAIIVMTPDPQFISIKQPLRHVQDLAQAISGKFGENCVLVGKAVSLIGMLAREFVFVFHEGASSYVKYSRKMFELLEGKGLGLKLNPILRVRLNTWDALSDCNTWIRLPEPLEGPFGTEELRAESFAARWRDVVEEQRLLRKELGLLRRPLDLIQFLEKRSSGSWHCVARQYEHLHDQLEQLEHEIAELKNHRKRCYAELRELKRQRVEAERGLGEHFRAKIFEQQPSEDDLAERQGLHHRVEEAIHAVSAKKKEIAELLEKQSAIVGAPEVRQIHEKRRSIELEAELKRLRLIRQAVITSKGLVKANDRPSAWWFPLLCPDGGWFRSAVSQAQCYLEELGA